MGVFRPRAGLEEEIFGEVRSWADRRARDLPPGHRFDSTFSSIWDVDALLAPYRGRPAGDEVVAAAHALGVTLARAWEAAGLRPRFVEDPETEEIAIEAEIDPGGGALRQRYLRDVCALVERPPEAVPVMPGWSAPMGGGGAPLLPRYLLGAALAAHPWADGAVAPALARRLRVHVWLQDSAARHLFPDLAPAEEPVVRAVLHQFSWPPVGAGGNPHGERNLAGLTDVVGGWGRDERGRLRRAISVLVRACDADLAYLAGAVARALGLGDDDPAVAAALAGRRLAAAAYPEGLVDAVAERLGAMAAP